MAIWKNVLDKITPYEPGKPIEEVQRQLGLKNVIKLGSNENPREPSARVLRAMARAAKSVNRYPDGGCFYLRKALAGKLSLPPDNIVFGNGSDEIIVLAVRAFLEAGEEVIVSDPTFLIYGIAALVQGAKVKTVPAKSYRYDLKGMLKAVTPRTKMIFIANPDNPTGTYVTKKELADFIKKLPRDIIVFIDEAYYEFARGGDYPETLPLIKEKKRNVIITRTFSKAYALAGLRIGYGLARKEIVRALDKTREPFNVNAIAQAAAVAALNDRKYLRESLALVRREKERFYKAFKDLGLEAAPTRANFILVNVKRDSKKVFRFLLERGIIVREMSAWGLEGFIRVNIGLRDENSVFLDAFRDAIKAIPESGK